MAATFSSRRSPWRMALLLAGAVVFVFLGGWIAGLFGAPPPGAPAIAGWVAIVFFGAMALLIARRMFDSGDVLRIDAQGIWWRDHADIVIPWSEIAAWGELSIRRQRMIALKLYAPERFAARGVAGALASANRSLTGADIVITFAGTTGKIEQAVAAIEDHFPSSR